MGCTTVSISISICLYFQIYIFFQVHDLYIYILYIYKMSLYMKKKAEPFPLDNVLLLNLLVAFPLYMSIFWSSTCPQWKKGNLSIFNYPWPSKKYKDKQCFTTTHKTLAELYERNLMLMRLWMSCRTLCSKMLETQSSTWPWKSCLVRGHMEKVKVLCESKTSLNSVGTCNVGCAKHVHKNTDFQTSRTTRWRNNERYHPPPHPPHPRQTTSRTRRWHKDKKWNSARPLRGADT